MRVSDLMDAMDAIAPLRFAESWDRVGLLIGRPERELDGPVLLTIDLTERVLHEARAHGCRAIVAYHAPIWDPIKRLTSESSRGRILLGCAEAGISVYTPHTALDAAPAGIADWLCEGLSADDAQSGVVPGRIAGDCRALSPTWDGASSRVKIVTFVPESALEQVRSALATAGAGRIGNYELCSYSVPGEGTFLPGQGALPAVGTVGTFERVREMRLEMICPKSAAALAIDTLRKFHPYEEPAIDVYDLLGTPRRNVGVGRRLMLDRPATIATIARRLGTFLGHARIKVALPGADEAITSLGVVPGAGEDLLDAAVREGCRAFVTGEMRHHTVIEALHNGVAVVLCGHTNTERGFLPRLAHRLGEMMGGIRFLISNADRDPLEAIVSG